MTSRIGKGLRKHVPNGQDEARTARSGLRSTEKSTAMQRTYSSQVGLDDSLKALAATVIQVEGASESGLAQQLDTVTQQVDQVNAENDELRAFFQEALQEAERLKKENEELRKLGEDAVLDQQLSKALQETDKLKLAADAYKKELLQQKVTELQSELAQTSKRLKVAEEENIGLTQAMKGAKGTSHGPGMGPRTDSLRSLDRASVADVDPSVRQAVLSRLQASPEERGDVEELLAAAAKALKDAGAGEAQLADAVALNAKLQGEVDQLNDTVFSKTFRAPSAWAEREVKYKMDKKAWDSQVERLQSVINKLKAENVEYRNNSKTDQFEARIQELEKKLQNTEGAKVTAQRALHELQLDMQAQVQKYTQLEQARRHQDASSEEGISSRIEEFDRGQVGVAQAAKAAKAPPTGRQTRGQPTDAPGLAAEAVQSEDAPAAGTHVQGVIVNMNAHNIGPQQPTAAPQDETDTHLHDQPTPDVISSAPTTSFTPSSSHAVHSSDPSAPAGNSAVTQAVATSSTQPETDPRPSADGTQHAFLSAAPSSASSSDSYSQQQASSHSVGAPSTTTSAHQPALQANIDGQSQAYVTQLQQAATDAAQPSAQPSTSSQQHPQQVGDQSQSSQVYASYQDKGFMPSIAEHQTQSTITTGATDSQRDAGNSPHDSQHHSPPSMKHFGSGALSRLDALGEDEPTSSENAAPQVAQPQPEAQQSSQSETGPHAEDQATSQDDSQTSDTPADATHSQAAEDQATSQDHAHTSDTPADATHSQAAEDQADSQGHAHASDISADATHSQVSPAGGDASEPSSAGVDQASVPNQEDTDQASEPASEGVAQAGAAAEQASASGRDTPASSAGPADEEGDSADDGDDDLLTLTDAVHHVARSTRQSRANSSDALDELDPSAGPSDYPAPPTPVAPPAQPQAAPRVTFEDAGHLAIPGSAVSGLARVSVDLNGVSSLSEASEQWTEDRVRQLEEDKAVIERLWGEHAQENDIGVLKFKLAEFESRCEMYEAQVTKMQRSMERSDQDKARVEEQLATAIALNHSGDKQGLTAMRERLQNVVSGRSSKTNQLEDRLKEAEQQLQQSYRERDGLEKQRAKLEHELASWSKKLGVDIPLPTSESVDASDASASSKGRSLSRWRSSASGFGVDGLSEGEVEVMHLREENEALMESLVRTKVDLAETEGEYLKTKRSLIRANEKLASLSERIDSLKAALSKAGVPLPSMTDSPSARSDTSTNPFGTPRSVMGTPKSAAAQALEAPL